VNGSGDKEKPIIIGKSANLRCFRGISDRATLPCEYFSQAKAWMESGILEEILRKLNARLRRENCSILLFIDNAPCHPEDLDGNFLQIKIVFFSAQEYYIPFDTKYYCITKYYCVSTC